MLGGSFSTARVTGWFDCRNDSIETVPAFGVVRITGINVVTADDERFFTLTIDKPDSGDASLIAFNSPFPIPTNAIGRCSLGQFVLSSYVDAGSVLAAGDLLGVQEDDWRLDTGGGYQFIGKVSKDGDPLVGVFERVFSSVTHLWGKVAADFTETQDIAMQDIVVLGGSWSGSTATALNTFKWSGTAGKNVFALVAVSGDIHAYQVEC